MEYCRPIARKSPTPEFLRNVSASETFQSMDMQTKKAGLDATVALKEPLQVLRVPAGAVVWLDGSSGCIVPKIPQCV